MWDLFNKKTVVGRKDYRCEECNAALPKGTRHVYCSGKVEGDFTDYRLCEECDLISTAWFFSDLDAGEGWPMGALRVTISEETGVDLADVEAWAREIMAKSAAEAARRKAVEAVTTSQAVADVIAERRRHVSEEGWTPAHDDEHASGELAIAAATYAAHAGRAANDFRHGPGSPPRSWPWSPDWWRPKDRRSELVKAGALILAEIDRLDRASAKP
jgi:hypothetical protein